MSSQPTVTLDLIQRLEQLLAEMRLLLAEPPPPDAPSAASRGAPRARLAIDGTRAGRRSAVRMNGSRVLLPDALFVLLLLLARAELRRPGSWSTKRELSLVNRAWMTSRLRKAFRGLLPAGLELIETDGRGFFRLNPAVLVEVDVAALAEHPDGVVQELAAKWAPAPGSAPPTRVASGA